MSANGSHPERGQLAASISSAMAGSFREASGRGPSEAKSYLLDDVVVCTLRGIEVAPTSLARHEGVIGAMTGRRVLSATVSRSDELVVCVFILAERGTPNSAAQMNGRVVRGESPLDGQGAPL